MKKRRNQPNRAHVRTKPTVKEAVRPLRVSIITSPKSQTGGPVLHRDVELVKAALLYADGDRDGRRGHAAPRNREAVIDQDLQPLAAAVERLQARLPRHEADA
ncbi:hypothetical protein [Nocardioides sp.]|uniref:hypothetical protein n=1 Tax=Nocardioides sp. TaxID=35761 RepID=UPI002ED95700